MAKPFLKPCPFCGGEAHLENHTRVYYKGETVRASLVHCKQCKTRTGKFVHNNYVDRRIQRACADAVEAWNRRAGE